MSPAVADRFFTTSTNPARGCSSPETLLSASQWILTALELAQVSLGQADITKGASIRLITLPSDLTC